MLPDHLLRAVGSLELNRPKLAEREAMEHLRSFPDDARGSTILSRAFLQQNRPHDAADAATRATAAAPEYAPAYYALGWAEMDRFDYNAAVAAAKQAKRIDPGNANHFYLSSLAPSKTKKPNYSKPSDRRIKMPTIRKEDEERFAKHGFRIHIEPERAPPTEGFEQRTRSGRFGSPAKPLVP